MVASALFLMLSVFLILSELAVSNFRSVHKETDETSAIASVKAIGLAESQYNVAYPQLGYACNLAVLGGDPASGAPSPSAAQLLDSQLAATGAKRGYAFSISNCTKSGQAIIAFDVNAIPISVGKTGDRGFCMKEDRSIKFDPKGGIHCTQELQ
jgi:type IV pilus assembly protein PilA